MSGTPAIRCHDWPAPESLTIWLPKPPDNANARVHWSIAVREKRAYWAQLTQHANLRHGFPPKPAEPLTKVRATIEWYYQNGRNHLDDDNAIRRLKPAFDFLVAHGYLAGDTHEHLTIAGVSKCVGALTPPLCSVRLTLTPVP